MAFPVKVGLGVKQESVRAASTVVNFEDWDTKMVNRQLAQTMKQPGFGIRSNWPLQKQAT